MGGNGSSGSIMRSKNVQACLMAMAFILPETTFSAQETRAPSEYDVKAAFLYNFALYTEWPASSVNTFEFCILGKDTFGSWLDYIRSKKMKGKPIRIRYIVENQDVKACHLLFIPAAEKDNFPRLAALIGQQSTLTITDSEQQNEKPNIAMIVMVPDGNRFTFDISQSEAKTAGLSFSSKLLRLARNVK
jgi:hypothetical protein